MGLFKLAYEVTNAFSTIMTYALFLVSAYAFTFYKMAEAVRFLLPSTDDRTNMYT